MEAGIDAHRQRKMHAVILTILGVCAMSWARADEADLSRFNTFDVRDGRITGELAALNNPRLTQLIKMRLESALTEKGLARDDAKPDLIATFELVTARGKETRAISTGRMSRGTRVVVTPRSEGSLTIDVLDAATHARVWRGVADDDAPNPKELAEHFDKMVEKAIKKFPSKKK